MKKLDDILQLLKKNPAVVGVFLTGSHGRSEATSSSDIDLVIILSDKTPSDLCMVYEIIDGAFADIFFFSLSDLRALSKARLVKANKLDEGILLSWIKMSHIILDRSGLIAELKKRDDIICEVSESEKAIVWQKVSYNFAQNNRYFDSGKSEYHEALEIRLLYSTVECLTALLACDSEPWRGEKYAVEYLKTHHPHFYKAFMAFQSSGNLDARMRAYKEMISYMDSKRPLFTYKKPVCVSKDMTLGCQKECMFWEQLSQTKPSAEGSVE